MAQDSQVITDFIGSGWRFPLGPDARGGIAMSRGAQDVEESIQLILETPIGERRMRPRFGCGIHDLVFAPNNPATHGLMAYYVAEALALWEPRIELGQDGVRVEPDPLDRAHVLITISYTLRATNQRRNLVYPFYLIPGEPGSEH